MQCTLNNFAAVEHIIVWVMYAVTHIHTQTQVLKSFWNFSNNNYVHDFMDDLLQFIV